MKADNHFPSSCLRRNRGSALNLENTAAFCALVLKAQNEGKKMRMAQACVRSFSFKATANEITGETGSHRFTQLSAHVYMYHHRP